MFGDNSQSLLIGCRVRVKDLDMGEEEVFELVGPGEEDYDNNRILTTSPIGQGLLGKKKGATKSEVLSRAVEHGALKDAAAEMTQLSDDTLEHVLEESRLERLRIKLEAEAQSAAVSVR